MVNYQLNEARKIVKELSELYKRLEKTSNIKPEFHTLEIGLNFPIKQENRTNRNYSSD